MAEPTETPAEQAARTLALLWRHERPLPVPARGPKPAVTVDEVVAAAIALADREGLDKVSVRAVAAELGLRAMSLYTYVPSKESLLVLMVDQVARADPPIPAGRPVRDRLRALAATVRAELLAHPWLLEVSPWRQVLGPGRMGRYERQLAALDGSGLDDVAMDRAVAVLTEFATGNARTAVAAAAEAARMSDARWWELHGPLLAEVMPAEEFPLASRVGAAAGEVYQAPADPDGAFDYGVGLLIEGILTGVGRPVP
ncbi:TetR/AcrR family transcriptional regulator [Nocardia thailandica]